MEPDTPWQARIDAGTGIVESPPGHRRESLGKAKVMSGAMRTEAEKRSRDWQAAFKAKKATGKP